MEKQNLDDVVNNGLTDEHIDKLVDLSKQFGQDITGEQFSQESQDSVKKIVKKRAKIIDGFLQGKPWAKHLSVHLLLCIPIGIFYYIKLWYQLLNYLFHLFIN